MLFIEWHSALCTTPDLPTFAFGIGRADTISHAHPAFLEVAPLSLLSYWPTRA